MELPLVRDVLGLFLRPANDHTVAPTEHIHILTVVVAAAVHLCKTAARDCTPIARSSSSGSGSGLLRAPRLRVGLLVLAKQIAELLTLSFASHFCWDLRRAACAGICHRAAPTTEEAASETKRTAAASGIRMAATQEARRTRFSAGSTATRGAQRRAKSARAVGLRIRCRAVWPRAAVSADAQRKCSRARRRCCSRARRGRISRRSGRRERRPERARNASRRHV